MLRVLARLNVGGPALHTTLLHTRLPPERYDCRLAVGSPGPREGDYLALRGVPLDRVIRLPSLGRELRPAADASTLVELVRLMRSFRPDVVHTHTAKAGALGRIAAIVTRVPAIVHTFHGHVLDGYFSPRRSRAFLAIERVLARRTDAIVAVSASVRSDLLARAIGQPERMAVIPPGLDLDEYATLDDRRHGAFRRELGVAADAPLVGIVARLAAVKAHEVFLAAAARVLGALPGCRFAIIGDGERRAELEAIAARLGLADRTSFVGWRSDLAEVLADLDVVALTSVNEGAPIALIEAMAASRAVVATRVGGVPDLVRDGENGLLAERGDVAGIADAIVALLQDEPRRIALGRAGRATVLPLHSAARLVADVDRLYGDLLRSPAAARARSRRARGGAVTAPAISAGAGALARR